MVDYSSARLKIERAQAHIREVDFLIHTYLRRRAYRIAQKTDFDTGKFGFEIALNEMPPIEISAFLGDAIHNLRTALDHLISAVVAEEGGNLESSYFPFARDREDIEKMIARRAKDASEEAKQICREMQPYPGGNDALYGLHKADITDKHQSLIVASAIGNFQYRLLPRSTGPDVTVQTNISYLSKEAYFVPSPEGREFEHPFEIGLSIEIVFPENGPLGGYPVVATLNELLRIVQDVTRIFGKRCP